MTLSELFVIFLAFTIGVHSQLDNLGFISIDCGLPANSNYTESGTNLIYTSDDRFIDTGTNYNISSEYVKVAFWERFLNLRSFPTGNRNCYTLKSLSAGIKYLVRAIFLYGNYDGLNKPPLFDLYIGINFWKTVNISDETSGEEIITVAQADYLQVCLVNTGLGTPFISGLELRPLNDIYYPAVTATQSAVLYSRLNMGPKITDDLIIRYPDDPYDRYWIPWNSVLSRPPGLTEISTAFPIRRFPSDRYNAPSAVIQTALTPENSSKIEYHWIPDPGEKNPGFLVVVYISELQILQGNAKREIDVYLNGIQWSDPFSPQYLYSDALFNDKPAPRSPRYNLSIVATSKSTLPPIINALELFRALEITGNGTDRGDVSAIIAIKNAYQMKRNWNGDPCAPRVYVWDGLNCSYGISSPPRITTVNLSSSGLSGGITTSFGNLTALEYLDLSHNKLTGTIPDVLAQLSSLVYLDLTDNQLNGSIPAGLLKKSQDGLLTLRIGDNLCAGGNSCEPGPGSSINPIILIIPIVVVVVLLVAILTYYIRRKRQASSRQDTSWELETRRFKYKELASITRNFNQVIGRGGCGIVYGGSLKNGTEVAVKLNLQPSKRAIKEFITEAKHLKRVHHKNLVWLIGYCDDQGHLGLVYEYMPGGTLEDHLSGKARSTRPLTWKERLQIALESAEGLEYLHKKCMPPLIHRDVKSGNILLNAKLEAKIADLGFSKAFGSNTSVNVSTLNASGSGVVLTPGYLDPEYLQTLHATEKSDVYSFGVVLLEVITGKPAVFEPGDIAVNIIQWVNQKLAKGPFDSVLDEGIIGNCNLKCVQMVLKLAFKCTERASSQRPTMTDVMTHLRKCLELENSVGMSQNTDSGNTTLYPRHGNAGNPDLRIDEPNSDTYISANQTFEMEHSGEISSYC